MPNLMKYLEFRGDLTLKQDELKSKLEEEKLLQELLNKCIITLHKI